MLEHLWWWKFAPPLGTLFALHSFNYSYFCHLQLFWHQSWAQLSAKSFTNILVHLHHSLGSVILPVLQFRKLREIHCLPKIPQLVSGRASRWTAVYLAVTPCSFYLFFLSSPYTPLSIASTLWGYFCLLGTERGKPNLSSTWALFSYFKIFIWCPFHSGLKLS